MELPQGTILNKGCYRIEERLSSGGFGIVYSARELGYLKYIGEGETDFCSYDESKIKKVVIKELFYDAYCHRKDNTNIIDITRSDKKEEFKKLVEKQIKEGQILKKLTHNHIVKNQASFRENNTAYIVMDYLHGQDLYTILKQNTYKTKKQLIIWIEQIADAMKAVHHLKILHLDINPKNIFIEKETNRAILIDFGISLMFNEDGKVTDSTSQLVVGKKEVYSPIEQNDISNIKTFAPYLDTYSLSLTLYECVTGNLPPSAQARISLGQELIPPSKIAGGLSDFWDVFFEKGINLSCIKRFQTAEDFYNTLKHFDVYETEIKKAKEFLGKDLVAKAVSSINNAKRFIGNTQTVIDLEKELCDKEIKKAKEFLQKKDTQSAIECIKIAKQYLGASAIIEELEQEIEKHNTIIINDDTLNLLEEIEKKVDGFTALTGSKDELLTKLNKRKKELNNYLLSVDGLKKRLSYVTVVAIKNRIDNCSAKINQKIQECDSLINLNKVTPPPPPPPPNYYKYIYYILAVVFVSIAIFFWPKYKTNKLVQIIIDCHTEQLLNDSSNYNLYFQIADCLQKNNKKDSANTYRALAKIHIKRNIDEMVSNNMDSSIIKDGEQKHWFNKSNETRFFRILEIGIKYGVIDAKLNYAFFLTNTPTNDYLKSDNLNKALVYLDEIKEFRKSEGTNFNKTWEKYNNKLRSKISNH